jgi:hypothetical protein
MRYDAKRRWSISKFQIMPRIIATYDVTVHAVDAWAYNGHLELWVELQDCVQIGFPGPAVEKSASDFQKSNPPFTSATIQRMQSKVLKIPKLGQFRASMSAEFNFRESLWDGSEFSYYACLYFVLHINTHYLFFSCLLPEGSGYQKPAYFLGEPKILDVNDKARFTEFSASRLKSIRDLPREERLIIAGMIS